jgi:hypothetical protein
MGAVFHSGHLQVQGMTVSESEPVSGHLDDVRPGGGGGGDGASSDTLLGDVSCLVVDTKHEADDEKVRRVRPLSPPRLAVAECA